MRNVLTSLIVLGTIAAACPAGEIGYIEDFALATDRALDWLIARADKLNDGRRHYLLRRLKRPDYPNLPQLVVKDLGTKFSRGFGQHGIHRQLLLGQLDACLKLKADLIHNGNFVNAYMTKLRPAPDIDWRHDAKARQAYLDRLWAFVSRLAPAFNSLKANVLDMVGAFSILVFSETDGAVVREASPPKR